MLFTGPNKAVAYQNWQLGAMKMLQWGLFEFSDLNIFEWPHLKSTLQSNIFFEQNLWTQVFAISFSNKGCFVPSQRIPKGLKSLKIWKATWENRAECREVESWLLCDIELKWNSFKADLTFPFDNALSQIWYIYGGTLHHVSYLVHLSFFRHRRQVALLPWLIHKEDSRKGKGRQIVSGRHFGKHLGLSLWCPIEPM